MRVNPYNKLLALARQFSFNVQNPKRKTMWSYPKEKLAGSWRLDDLAERVQAADQLGHDVQLKVIDGALHVQYVKRCEVPFELR